MVINELDPSRQFMPLVQQQSQERGIEPSKSTSFAGTLREFVGDVNGLQKDAAEQRDKMIKGEPVDLHDVMITAQKAKTSFQLLVELRNKAMDLYREVNRMQV
jgi:flagellar hook-basal body complex protein FliE